MAMSSDDMLPSLGFEGTYSTAVASTLPEGGKLCDGLDSTW